jgi:hypothetical protein
MSDPTLDSSPGAGSDAASRPLSARATKMLRRYQRLRTARRMGRTTARWGFLLALAGAVGLLAWQAGPDAWDRVDRLRHASAPPVAPAEDSLPALTPVSVSDDSTSDSSATPRPRASTVMGRYEEAMDSIHGEMRQHLGEIGFTGALEPARIARPAGLTAARRAVESARNIFRQYRRDTRLTEEAYLDSLTGRRRPAPDDPALRTWDARIARAESYGAAAAADSMLQATDSIVRFLATRAGAYRPADSTLAFDEPQDAEHYRRFLDRLRHLTELGGGAATVAEAARVAE